MTEKQLADFKVVALIVFAGVIFLSVVGFILLLLFRPDASATFISGIVIVVGLLSTFAISVYGLQSVGKTVQEVKQQTNGTTHRLMNRNGQLVRELMRHNIPIPAEEMEKENA